MKSDAKSTTHRGSFHHVTLKAVADYVGLTPGKVLRLSLCSLGLMIPAVAMCDLCSAGILPAVPRASCPRRGERDDGFIALCGMSL